MPGTGRLAGHTFVDALSAQDESVNPEIREASTQLALQRLRDIHAVTVLYDEETGRVDVDVSHIVSPAVTVMIWLASRLSDSTGQSRDEICAQLREYLDQAREGGAHFRASRSRSKRRSQTARPNGIGGTR